MNRDRTARSRWSTVVLVASVVSAVFVARPLLAIPDGLVHHWNLDEGPDWHDAAFRSRSAVVVARDSVGAAHATLRNMDASDWVSGRQFTALEFDGSDDYLETATSISKSLAGDASLAFWIRTTSTGGRSGLESPGVTGVASVDGEGAQWGWIDRGGRIALSIRGADGVVRSAAPISDGRWHHVAISRDAKRGAVRLWVDGKLSDRATGPIGSVRGAFSSLGRIESAGGSSLHLRGRLDQIHVFDRAIDARTVEQLVSNHAPKIWTSRTRGTSAARFSTESVLYRAYDPDGDELAVVAHGAPKHGEVESNGDGTFTYGANAGFTGEDSFRVTIEDGRGGFATADVEVVVLGASTPSASNRTTTFTDCAPVEAGGWTIALSGRRVPRAFDADGDGDNDLFVGHGGTVWRYENTGTARRPSFAAGVRVQDRGEPIALSRSASIAVTGVADLFVVDASRRVRVYKSGAVGGVIPIVQQVTVRDGANRPFVLPDERFDVADWDGDSLPDIVSGTRSGEVRVYRNLGTAEKPRFDGESYAVIESGSYNLEPRVFDINRNGKPDYVRGINWGSIDFWFDPPSTGGLGNRRGRITVTDADGRPVDMKRLTDGAIVDFADLDGDGVFDIVIGGNAGSEILIAYGRAVTTADSIAAIEALYDAYRDDLGAALEADGQKLLEAIRNHERNIISHMYAAALPERRAMFAQLAKHVRKYPFLQLSKPLDTEKYHHVPGIAGQNLLTMHQLLPDTPTHRRNVAGATGLTGLHREIYLAAALHVGDNQRGTRGQLESVLALMRHVPPEIFPDTLLTLNHYRGDGRGGHVASFTSAKNTFDFGQGRNVAEWAADLSAAIESHYGEKVHRGDYFTFVMGHEVTHSLDAYVRSRANKDLARRWGQTLVRAAGPDVVGREDGWIDRNATRKRFKSRGHWDGDARTWNEAWKRYWKEGPGGEWNALASMRLNIQFFLGAPQESLATQANHHHAHSEARLIGAADRWRRAVESGLEPMHACVDEVVLFLDFQSAGLNKVVLYDTTGVPEPYPHARYDISWAWLERDDVGRITTITVDDRVYRVTYDADGRVETFVTSFSIGPSEK